MRWFLGFVAVPLVLFGSPAFAASQTDFADCMQMQDLDRGITGCSHIAQDESGLPHDRAVAYFDRGVDYYSRGDLERAISDWSAAIKLDATYVHAYNNRAKAYRAKGDYMLAIADDSDAIKLDPSHATAYKGRGIALLLSGQTAKAEADFKQAIAIDPSDPYAALWLDMTMRRNHEPSRIKEMSLRVNMGAWPAPLLLLYAGRVTPHEVAVAAQNIDPVISQARLCDAYFYIGESYMPATSKEDKDQAVDLFQRSVKECPVTADEHAAASAELRAMGEPLQAQGAEAEGQSAQAPKSSQ
ncbi:MAG TPA: tetratricopeptide repeat protein [Methylovirgula sp.]|nr:tetratricopeptide repeat protein [Methylovirgula sp.]